MTRARQTSPVPGADEVRVGPLQGHRPRIAAQNSNNSGGQLFNPWNYATHDWTDYCVGFGTTQQTTRQIFSPKMETIYLDGSRKHYASESLQHVFPARPLTSDWRSRHRLLL